MSWGRWMLVVGVVASWLGAWACDIKLPPKPCNSDAQCDIAGFYCDTSQNLCVQNRICASNMECGFPQAQCLNQRCVVTGICRTNEDCKEAEDCIDGRCLVWNGNEAKVQLRVGFDDKGEPTDLTEAKRKGLWSGTPKMAAGYRGKSISLNGTNFVSFRADSKLQTPQVTAQAWVRLRALPLPSEQMVLLRYSDEYGRKGYILSVDEKGSVLFSVASASSAFSCRSSAKIVPGLWFHVAGSFDGARIRCFRNGRLDGDVPWIGILRFPDGAGRLVVGQGLAKRSGVRNLRGEIDEVVVRSSAQVRSFSPGLMRYLYVASRDKQTIHVIDTTLDLVEEKRSFQPTPFGFPIYLSPNGKYLFLWNETTSKLLRFDMSDRRKTAEVTLTNFKLLSLVRRSRNWWVWGQEVRVLSWELTKTPLKKFSSFPASFGEDITWLPLSQPLWGVPSRNDKKILFFNSVTNQQQMQLDLSSPPQTLRGTKPLAVAASRDGLRLYVSFQDQPRLRVYQYLFSQQAYVPKGEFDTKRSVKHLLIHPREPFLYYAFENDSLLYRLDLLKSGGIRPIDKLLSTGKTIKAFSSLYRFHLHHLGQKFYVQNGTTGIFYVVNIRENDINQSNDILKEININVETLKKPLSIVGVNAPGQAY